MNKKTTWVPTCTHWGNYKVETDGASILNVQAYDVDKEPTPIGESLKNTLDSKVRIARPMVRQSYLASPSENTGSLRGSEPFVPVDWDTALTLAADALARVKAEQGNESIYGSSYGWASAGRFHHAQSQIHRFLNQFGGYTDSKNSYSTAAGQVMMDHVMAIPFADLVTQAPTPEDMAEHCKTLVLFGGAPLKNTQINAGGLGKHSAKSQLLQLQAAGVDVINVSPVKDDVLEALDAAWLPCRPGSDVALMLGLAYTLVSDNLHDKKFIERYTVGFDQFLPYLMGEHDGVPKDADWACALTGIPFDAIQDLAWRLSEERSVLGISWSLQRQEYGEQSYWMITTLGAMLGHMGQPGGGVAYGYGCIHNMGFGGRRMPPYSTGAFTQGKNPVKTFIPVARLCDMLNHPGEEVNYDGQSLIYPDIELIYWAGGNPYHHHQDLNTLRKAWEKPQTVIVNESVWTATARHADIVFPANTFLERNDLGGSSYDAYLSPMKKVVESLGESRSDYAIFSALAEKLGFADQFTEGRNEMEWVEHLYNITRSNAAEKLVELPSFNDFWAGEQYCVENQIEPITFTLEKYRHEPDAHPLKTPSGKIEIFSQTISDFNYPDCQGHPRWYDREEWLGSPLVGLYPLHLISNQPRTRLHSQYDHGVTSRSNKIQGRERARINSKEAHKRGIEEGDIVRLFNERGACLAGIEISENIADAVIELPTGAWFDPNDQYKLEAHGNPNVLTQDIGTSSLAQGCSAYSCLVEVEKYEGPLPDVTVFNPPVTR